MKNNILCFVIGFIAGAVLFGVACVYADVGVLFNSAGVELGTVSNPLYITQ